MKLGYVIIYVEDVVAATRFYEQAFGLETAFIDDSKMYGEMGTGSTTLSFAHNSLLKEGTGIEAGQGVKNGFEIAFTTDDVAAVCKTAVDGGAKLLSDPADKPWGQTVAYVQDPFGTIISICTPMG